MDLNENTENSIIQKEYFRAKEAAGYLGIGLSTVWLFAKQGLLKPIKITERVSVFRKKDLDEFVESRRIENV